LAAVSGTVLARAPALVTAPEEQVALAVVTAPGQASAVLDLDSDLAQLPG
jgi:hypothetical protein